LQDQLGLVVAEVEPFGLAGSAGSTPLRIRVKGDPDTWLFAKLYARSHLRADRWYKLGRELLYGRLEDEKPFNTVRRLVQQEDYALQKLYLAGLPSPRPYGVVELTPEREYLLVTEFFAGATELGEAEVTDQVIDDGLGMIRKLWATGLAHRDIKPANLLVRDGRLLLIDVAFVEVRPSPWRQAVDLANMMLCLALRSSPELVYQRALRQFTVEEITELLVPTGRVVLFNHDPNTTRLQIFNLDCADLEPLWLQAQAVPSASLVPCVELLPGWAVAGANARNGQSAFTLDHDRAGKAAMVVRLTPTCDPAGATQMPSQRPGVRHYEQTERRADQFTATWYDQFPGGCVTSRLDSTSDVDGKFATDAPLVLGFATRQALQDALAQRSNGRLHLDPAAG
jgi:tRNA A-37 threonylcarbamoyl transferase component Bud32